MNEISIGRREFLAASAVALTAAHKAHGQSPGSSGRPAAGEPDHFVHGRNLQFQGPLSIESQRANKAFADYLRANARASDVLHRLESRVHLFLDNSPRIIVSKCIDGRMHGSDEKGYPPTAVTNIRTEGNNVDLSPNNNTFWNRLHSVILDASRHTAGLPALYLALGHRGVLGSGCAAHHENDDETLATVEKQATDLRARFDASRLYVLHGMVNTDDLSLRLIFPDRHELDTTQILRRLNTREQPLTRAADCFQRDFLENLLDDRETNTLVRGLPPKAILEGAEAAMFHDLQVMLAMQAYLTSETWHVVHNRSRNNVIFEPRLYQFLIDLVDSVDGLPRELRAPLVYMMLWNVAYTLHARQRLEELDEQRERILELQHAENMVAYGDGFETQPRNTLVLVKPGRGNDVEALTVARQVITLHRHRRQEQRHPPLIHVNAEVSGSMETWPSFNFNVLAKLMTMTDNVQTVFDHDCRILTTYSYREQKRFYPVRIEADPTVAGADICQCFPSDIGREFTIESFSHNELKLREDNYSRSIVSPDE